MPQSLSIGAESLESTLELLRKDGLLPPDVAEVLSAKLLRLNQLESEFDATLEREKLAALKEFAYGASHEINNPLANISTRAQALLTEEHHPERKKKLATIVAQAFRAHEMISDLMLFAKPPPLNPERIALTGLLSEVAGECQQEAHEQGTVIDLNCDRTDLEIVADATQLAVALKALVRNSLEALGQGGTICLTAKSHKDQIVLTIADDGPGMSPEVRRHAFDPFYSGREAGRGLGFGLPKCWRIVELHGGRMEVESGLGQGTTVHIIFPA